MFKWLLIAALALSLLFCGWRDFDAQQRLREQRAEIIREHADLQSLRDIDPQVQAFLKQKEALQLRIDIINQLKQNQKAAADAVGKLSNMDASTIESAAVVNGGDLVINRR